MNVLFRAASVAALISVIGLWAGVSAHAYPTKPIRMIVPWNPGGTSDTIARILGQKMNESWSQPVVIDTRAGASGIIGTEIAMRAPADGYTLLRFRWGQTPWKIIY